MKIGHFHPLVSRRVTAIVDMHCGAKTNQARKASAIGKEWFEQIAAFEAYCIGKTVAEIQAMPTKAANESHPTVPDVADLATTVTIDVGGYIEALVKAASLAK